MPDLAQELKQRYPQYAHVPDIDLVDAFLAQHPDGKVPTGGHPTPISSSEPDTWLGGWAKGASQMLPPLLSILGGAAGVALTGGAGAIPLAIGGALGAGSGSILGHLGMAAAGNQEKPSDVFSDAATDAVYGAVPGVAKGAGGVISGLAGSGSEGLAALGKILKLHPKLRPIAEAGEAASKYIGNRTGAVKDFFNTDLGEMFSGGEKAIAPQIEDGPRGAYKRLAGIVESEEKPYRPMGTAPQTEGYSDATPPLDINEHPYTPADDIYGGYDRAGFQRPEPKPYTPPEPPPTTGTSFDDGGSPKVDWSKFLTTDAPPQEPPPPIANTGTGSSVTAPGKVDWSQYAIRGLQDAADETIPETIPETISEGLWSPAVEDPRRMIPGIGETSETGKFAGRPTVKDQADAYFKSKLGPGAKVTKLNSFPNPSGADPAAKQLRQHRHVYEAIAKKLGTTVPMLLAAFGGLESAGDIENDQ